MNIRNSIPATTLKRLPMYLSYLKSLPKDAPANISSTTIASVFDLNEVQVRKDLAAVGDGGRPKIGYLVEELIGNIEDCLGYRNLCDAVLVGAGNLGRALLSYDGFSDYGMNVAVAFDTDEALIRTQINGKHILSADKIEDLCRRMKIKIGILAVPDSQAQSVCDRLVAAGVRAIWNFTAISLRAPAEVSILNEHIGRQLPALLQSLNGETPQERTGINQ